MSPAEYATNCAALKARWPSSRNFAGVVDLYPKFANLPAAAMSEAVDHLFDTGSRNPTMSEVRALTGEIASARYMNDPTATSCDVANQHGALAVLPDDEAPPGKRRVICSRCKSEWIRPANQARTVGEIADGIIPPTDTGTPTRDITGER